MLLDKTVRIPDLAACVRHDLRDPLGAISHWLELLDAPGLDPALKDRAVKGIRAGVGEQLEQIIRLAELLDHQGRQTSGPSGGPDAALAPVDLAPLVHAACMSIAPGLQSRIELRLSEVQRRCRIRADGQALVRALTALSVHGIKQLVAGEHLRISLCCSAPTGVCRLVMQIITADTPADQPWRALADPHATPALALLHARSVLSLHCVEVRIATTTQKDDTALLDFALMDATDEPCTDC